jgi:hypothetical protein
MATVINRPTTGSAQRNPRATPPTPSSTARLVKRSVRACRPSKTKAEEPICRRTRMVSAGDDLVADKSDQVGGRHHPSVN